MESGEDTRIVFIRVRDTCGITVLQQNQAIAMNNSDLLQCVFLSLDIVSHSLVAAMPKPTKTSLDTEAVPIRPQMLLKRFNVVEAVLIHAGVGDHTRGRRGGAPCTNYGYWSQCVECLIRHDCTSSDTIHKPF